MPPEVALGEREGKVVGSVVHVVVDLPAVRPARLARTLVVEDLTDDVRELRGLLRGARSEKLPRGVALVVRLEVPEIAQLADAVRAEADAHPFWSFRLLADPPACRLEVTGDGRAGELARAVFGELAG
jgi:hypothetical protein